MSQSSSQSDGNDDGDDGIEVQCHHCGYVWIYTGQMYSATCPRCNTKTPTGLGPNGDEEA